MPIEVQKTTDPSGSGAIRTEIKLRDRALRLFKPSEMNAILAEAARKMGLAWVSKWLPLRFTPYARTLGYDISARYSEYKESVDGVDIPLVGPSPRVRARRGSLKAGGYIYGTAAPGDKLINTSKKATATATAKGGSPTVRIKIPGSHAVPPIVSKTLRTIPPKEIRDIAKVFGAVLASLIDGADSTDPGRSTLTAAQRAAMPAKRQQSKTQNGRKVA